jgi:hypothetical protein
MKRIVEKLRSQTMAGSIKWKLTDDEKSFLHSTSNSTIVVTRRLGPYGGPVELTVLNKQGREVERINTTVDEGNAKAELEDLWEFARQSALNVNKELDQVLEELDEGQKAE